MTTRKSAASNLIDFITIMMSPEFFTTSLVSVLKLSSIFQDNPTAVWFVAPPRRCARHRLRGRACMPARRLVLKSQTKFQDGHLRWPVMFIGRFAPAQPSHNILRQLENPKKSLPRFIDNPSVLTAWRRKIFSGFQAD
jgi:hypothetical protein